MLRIAGSPLQQRSWDNLLRSEALTKDIFQDFEGIMTGEKKALPNGIIAKVTLAPGANYHTLGLLKNLSGAPITGRSSILGSESDQEVRELNIYSNDVSKAVNTETYGIDAFDKAAYKLLAKTQPQISLYHKEIKGLYTRQAILERYSRNLLDAPTSLTARWNENVLIKNVTLANQPAYHQTNATFETNISNALTAGGAGTAWDINFLSVMEYWVTAVKRMKPMDNGKYIVLVPSSQAVGLRNVSSSGSISQWYRDSMIAEVAKNAASQYLGSYGALDLFEDPRAPVVGDSSGNITAYYKGAGDDDDRGAAAGTTYDCGMILGKGGIVEAEHEKLHFEEEVQNYGKVVGVAGIAGYGMNRLVFDNIGAESASSAVNQGSAIVLTRRATLTA